MANLLNQTKNKVTQGGNQTITPQRVGVTLPASSPATVSSGLSLPRASSVVTSTPKTGLMWASNQGGALSGGLSDMYETAASSSVKAPVILKPQAQPVAAAPVADQSSRYLDSNGQTDYSKLIREGIASGASADDVQGWLDGRGQKIAEAGGALDQYMSDPLSQAAQAYVAYKRQPQYSSYEDFYDQGGYAEAAARQQSIMDAQLRQLENYYGGQRNSINTDAEEQARQAYIAYMQGQNTMPQALAASGYTGGLADSQRLALELGYQNNQRAISQAQSSALNDLSTALNNARLTASMEGLQAQEDIMRDAVSAYQDWQSRQNATNAQNYLTLLGYDIQGQQAAQQSERDLANELALLAAREQYTAQADEDAKRLAGAQLLAGGGDYAGLGAYYQWTPEQIEAMNAYAQGQSENAFMSSALERAAELAKVGDYSGYEALGINTDYAKRMDAANLAAKLKSGASSGTGGSGGGGKYLSDPYAWLANQGIKDQTLAYNALLRQGYTSTAAKEVAQGYIDQMDGGLDLAADMPTIRDGEPAENMAQYRRYLEERAAQGLPIQDFMSTVWAGGRITDAQMEELQNLWNSRLKAYGK